MLTFTFNLLAAPAMAFLVTLLTVLSPSAQAYVLMTPAATLHSFFAAGETVEATPWTPDAATSARIEASLGYPIPHQTWTFHVGFQAGAPVGYALFDQQLGQHEPIDFAVLLTPQATVARVEILVYREAYGDGVRSPAFRSQFQGLGPGSLMRPGKEIRVVSGATVSTRSLSIGVRRAVVLVQAFLGHGSA